MQVKFDRLMLCSAALMLIVVAAGYTTATRTLPQYRPARTLLESHGYTAITITGWDWIAADAIWRPSTGFVATDSTGQLCSGAVVVDSDGQTRIRFH